MKKKTAEELDRLITFLVGKRARTREQIRRLTRYEAMQTGLIRQAAAQRTIALNVVLDL